MDIFVKLNSSIVIELIGDSIFETTINFDLEIELIKLVPSPWKMRYYKAAQIEYRIYEMTHPNIFINLLVILLFRVFGRQHVR